MKNWFIVFSICLICAIASAAQDRGSIQGVVVDETGAPVDGAKVHADSADSRARGSLVRYVESDAKGRYVIDRLEWGKYKLFAMKEDADYPNMYWSFYSDEVFPTATIKQTAPTAEVRIQLGPKAGILTGTTTNAATGAPVNAGFKLTRAASPKEWISTSVAPNYRVLVPSSTDVLLEVSSLGFKTWKLPGYLNLKPGAEMHLDIPLEPSHDPNLHPSKLLVPQGYVGWVLLEYNVKGAEPVPTDAGMKVFKFPPAGTLNTSSEGPQRGADDQYFFYSPDGSVREVSTSYRSGGAMLWGQYEGSKGGVMNLFGFFIGSEEKYKKYQSKREHPGPISAP